MAQLLLDVPIDKRRELPCSDRLRIILRETKDVLLPLMGQHISEKVFTAEQDSHFCRKIQNHMIYVLDNKQFFERATFVGLGIVSSGTAWEPYSNVLIGEEFLYISQMILDDIVDRQMMRMDRPTLNNLIGNEKAMIIAEIFESEGYNLIQTGIAGLPTNKQVAIMSKTFGMMKNIYYSQYIDVENMEVCLDTVTIDQYLHFLRYTTPADIANCFYIGSMIGGADDDLATQFHELGLNLGMLMQIKDDFIDFLNENVARKNIFSDIKNSQKRIPIILAYNFLSKSEERGFLKSILGKNNLNSNKKENLRQIILSDEVMSKAKEISGIIEKRALKIIKELPFVKEEYRMIISDILRNIAL